MKAPGGAGNDAVRKVGRPRSRPAAADALEPREEILRVAAELFATRGYTATSTRLIADGVGLRQGSLFHHFAKKEEILAELLDRTVRPALAFSAWLDQQPTSAAVALHALSWWDVHNLCSRPDNLAGLQLIHEARDERFSAFWGDRDLLRSGYAAHIAAVHLPTPTSAIRELATELVFGLVESVLTWFDRQGSDTPGAVADAIAEAALRIVGIAPGAVLTIAEESSNIRRGYRTTIGSRLEETAPQG